MAAKLLCSTLCDTDLGLHRRDSRLGLPNARKNYGRKGPLVLSALFQKGDPSMIEVMKFRLQRKLLDLVLVSHPGKSCIEPQEFNAGGGNVMSLPPFNPNPILVQASDRPVDVLHRLCLNGRPNPSWIYA